MKITKTQLKQMIEEELAALRENTPARVHPFVRSLNSRKEQKNQIAFNDAYEDALQYFDEFLPRLITTIVEKQGFSVAFGDMDPTLNKEVEEATQMLAGLIAHHIVFDAELED
jgi:ABC-type transporter Mla subunit MlaD